MANDKPCVRCGSTERYSPVTGKMTGSCKSCAKAASIKWQRNNPEKLKVYRAKSYYKNQGNRIEYAAEYRRKKPEVIKAWSAKNWSENKEKLKEKNAKYRLENKGKIRLQSSKYWRNNPEKKKAIDARRRARLAGAEGNHTAGDWLAILDHYGHSCLRCGSTKNITKDHIVALDNGGSNWPDNLQPLCGPCNSSKGAWNSTDYRPDAGAECWQQVELIWEPV